MVKYLNYFDDEIPIDFQLLTSNLSLPVIFLVKILNLEYMIDR